MNVHRVYNSVGYFRDSNLVWVSKDHYKRFYIMLYAHTIGNLRHLHSQVYSDMQLGRLLRPKDQSDRGCRVIAHLPTVRHQNFIATKGRT